MPKSIAFPEPHDLEEARTYIGKEFSKFFMETKQWYQGVIEDVDEVVENDEGVEERGIFFRAFYPVDEDREHLLWADLHKLLLKSKQGSSSKNRKRTSGAAAAGQGDAAAHAEADQVPRSTKRQRQQQQQRPEVEGSEDSDMQDAEQDEAAAGESVPEFEGLAGRGSAGKGRGAAAHQQQQQQQHRKERRPAAAAAAGGGSAGPKRQRQQQQQQPLPQQQRRRQQQRQEEQEEEERETSRDEEEEAEAGASEQEEESDAGQDEELQDPDPAALEQLLQQPDADELVVRSKGLAGHLKTVQVQNFMCHRNFEMDFGTHVNVISGSNGSGKSAVLQAMQCCLGVKARNTGRGDNIKEFVKTGERDAIVRVSLWNTGEDAYHPETFGEHLTIERTIKLQGAAQTPATSWKLLTQHGQKIATNKKKVDELLEHLNINAGNPLAVMTQDTSRNFLCGSVADRKKYELFMEATCLADMQDNLKLAQGYVDEMQVHIQGVKVLHKERMDAVRGVRDKLKKLEESEGLRDQARMYERASSWAAVEVAQATLKANQHEAEVVQPEKLKTIQGVLEKVTIALENGRRKEEQLTATYGDLQAKQASFAAEAHSLGEQLKEARAEQRRKAKAFRDMDAQLKSVLDELRQLMETTKESNDDRQDEFNQRLQQHQAEVARAEQELQDANRQLLQHQEQLQALQQRKAEQEGQIQQLRNQLAGTEHNIQSYHNELQVLQAAKDQKLAVFGVHAKLRAEVDKHKRKFDRVPIGPIGAHLTLTHQMWDVAAEVVLGAHLEKWLVHSDRDQQTLRQLARSLAIRNPTIIIANFDRPAYTIRQNLTGDWQNLRQFMKIEHPQYSHIIDNKLMDLTHYELVVVDQDESRCKHVIYHADQRPAGAPVALAVHQSGRSWRLIRKSIKTNNYWADQRPRLSSSAESNVQQLQQLLTTTKGQHQQLQQQLVHQHAELQQLMHQLGEVQKSARRLLAVKNRSNHKVQQLQTQLPVMEPLDEEEGDDMLAETRRQLQQQLEQLQLARNRAETELQDANRKQEQLRQVHEIRRNEMDDILTQMTGQTEELAKTAQAIQKACAVKAQAEERIQLVQQNIQTLLENVGLQEGQVEVFRQAARKLGTDDECAAALAAARQETRRLLEEKMRRRRPGQAAATERQVAEAVDKFYQDFAVQKAVVYFKKQADERDKQVAGMEQDAGGNKAQLEHQLKRAEFEYKRHDKSARHMIQVVQVCVEAVAARWERYSTLFDDVTTTVSNKFMNYMHRRGHAGRVRVDAETGELQLMVRMNVSAAAAAGDKKSKAVKDLKQLSGGERSFTTVAFILALGEYTESPFRAMDEFDVFMDAINRRIATQTLLEFAREKRHLQFIFLTPQDLQAVEDAKQKLGRGRELPEGFVKVVQMRPARPNQQQQQ